MKIATICCSIFIGIFLASCSAHDRASAPNVITIISCKRAQSYEISRTFAPKGMKAVGKNLDCDIPRNVIVIKISDAEYEYASKYLKYIDSESFSDDKIMYDPQRIIVDSEFTYSNSRTNIDNSSFGDIKKMKNLIDLNWYHNLSGRDFSGSVYPRSLGSGVAAFRRSEYAKRNGIALCVKKMSAFYVSGSDVVFPIEDSDIIRLCIDDVIKEELP